MSKETNRNIEVGDYVRTKNGKIRKVKSTVAQYYITDRLNISDNNQFTKEDIVKHSKNIIDLIEVGDFVNGYRVVDKYLYAGEKPVLETERIENNVYCLCEGDIREILTREKYTQNCYKVEREIV